MRVEKPIDDVVEMKKEGDGWEVLAVDEYEGDEGWTLL